MKVIRYGKMMMTLSSGMLISVSGNDLVFESPPLEWRIPEPQLFEAVYEFMQGREVMFDIDKYKESERRARERSGK